MSETKIFLPRWTDILLMIGSDQGICARDISKELKISSFVVNNFSVKMTKIGLLIHKHNINKKIKNLYLTDEGKKIYESLAIIRDKISEGSR